MDSHRKRIQNRRPSSHKKPKRRRKEVVAVKRRRRSGPKEKFVTSWTIKSCSINQLTKSCTKKFHLTNWSHQALYPKDWRSEDHLHDVLLSNCVTKVNYWNSNFVIIIWWPITKRLEYFFFNFNEKDWLNKSFNIMLRLFTQEQQRVMIQLLKNDFWFVNLSKFGMFISAENENKIFILAK